MAITDYQREHLLLRQFRDEMLDYFEYDGSDTDQCPYCLWVDREWSNIHECILRDVWKQKRDEEQPKPIP